jgi:hypothetical protein
MPQQDPKAWAVKMKINQFNQIAPALEGKEVTATVMIPVKKSKHSIFETGFFYKQVKGKFSASLGGAFSNVIIGKWRGQNGSIEKIHCVRTV